MGSRSTAIVGDGADFMARAQTFGTYDGTFDNDVGAQPRVYSGLSDFLRLVRRRRRLILATIAVITIAAFVFVARTTPVYRATTTVLVKPLVEQAWTMPDSNTPLVAAPQEAARISTKVELLASSGLASQIARDANLDKIPEFTPSGELKTGLLANLLGWARPPAPQEREALTLSEQEQARYARKARMERVTEQFKQRTEVKRVGDSNLIAVTVTSTDPLRAARLANRIPQTYIENWEESQVETYTDVRQRVETARQEFEASALAVAEYRKAHGLALDRPQDFQQSQLTQASIGLIEARADSAAAASRVNSGVADSNAVTSPLLEVLRSQEATLGKRLSELQAIYGSGYPEVATTTAQLDDVRRRMSAEARLVQAETQRQAEVAAAAVAARGSQLAGDAGAARSAAIGTRFADVQLQQLEREADADRALYISLLGKQKEVGSKGSKADISIVSRASPTDLPSFPRPDITMATAFISSILFAIILALGVDAVDDRLRNADQIARLLRLPTLAMVPELSKLNGRAPHELITEKPRSAFAESVRNIVIELEARRTMPGSQVIVVTSPLPDDGKSTISTCLAAAATSIGRRAIVVDLDMRSRRSMSNLGADGSADLIAFLTNTAELEEVIAVEGQGPFSRINIRQRVIDPGGLLESPRLRALIDELRLRFDLVVLNVPPILPVRDAKTLSRLADGTLLVIRWGKTDPGAARTAVDAFGAGIIGVVLNRVDYRDHARRAYGDAIDHSARHGGDYLLPDDTAERRPALTRWVA